ncbi:hypothetical protein EXIGLDRAFT_827922 [Exidia glandulosa HHB12029]|uniref:Uncharacterized protein n=1 Tax=Exidia glandulosa HHB12029 TaxID=1314781 RepID=A0A165QRM6_EXIGL|nr:hypothetical protein EXIGLDRAFT_827922 [Exidia glandulosa HHB12029]
MLSLWKQSQKDGDGSGSATRKLADVDAADDDPRPAKRRKRDLPETVAGSYAPTKPDAGASNPPSERAQQILDQTKRVNTVAPFDSWKAFAETLKALVLYYVAVETDFGFRPSSPGRRVVLYVLRNVEDVSRSAQVVSNSIGIRVGTLCGIPTAASWTTSTLCHDFIVLHGLTLLAALEDGLVLSPHISLCVLDSQLVDDTSFSETFSKLLVGEDSPRLFLPLLHKQSDLQSDTSAQVARLADAMSCDAFAPVSAPEHHSDDVVFYAVNDGPLQDTALFAKIFALDPKRVLHDRYAKAREVLHELGPCASDIFWKCTLKDTCKVANAALNGTEGEEFVKAVTKLITEWPTTVPRISGSSANVTSHFAQLVGILKAREVEKDTLRCIVFARCSVVADMIVFMLGALGSHLGFLRPFAMTQRSYSQLGIQERVLADFQKGTINVLVCTSVVDDLELPQCNLVVQFDLCQSRLSYARASRIVCDGGKSVLMAQKGNAIHRRILLDLSDASTQMRAWIPMFRTPESAVAPLLLEGPLDETLSDDEDMEEEDGVHRVQDAVAGGHIGLTHATAVVHRLAARLASVHHAGRLQPLFQYTEPAGSSGLVSCTVFLPQGATIRQLQGPACADRPTARRAACLELCSRLHRTGELDYRLFPLRRTACHASERFPVIPDTPLDDGDAGVRRYPRKSVIFWDHIQRDGYLYPTVISFDGQDEYHLPRRPMLLLTRSPLPPVDGFNLYFDGQPTAVRLDTAPSPFQLDDERTKLLHAYTLRVARALTNKAVTCPLETMPYFLAPWDTSIVLNDKPLVEQLPWDSDILEASTAYIKPVTEQQIRVSDTTVRNLVLQDRWSEFTRRFRGLAVRHDMSPRSKPPPDATGANNHASFVDQYAARIKSAFVGLKDENQPMFEVTRLPGLVNRLFPTSRSTEDGPDPPKFIIPEVSARLVIPADTFETAHLIPCCLRRIEDNLLMKMLNQQFFNNEIDEHLLLSAISPPSLCGELDYQRLELLGDSVLKFLCSASLFVLNPDAAESVLHLARQDVISNRALLQAARRVGLPPFILMKPLSVKSWLPPHYDYEPEKSKALSEEDAKDPTKVAAAAAAEERRAKSDAWARTKRQQDQSEQWIGDKTIADVTEAILGAAFLSGGKNLVLRVASRLTVKLQDYVGLQKPTVAAPSSLLGALRVESREYIEQLLGRPISKPHIIAQALTHSVASSNKNVSYQRLEFLGDAILDFLAVRHVWRYEKLDPGALTLLKNAMVSNSTLAALCVHSRLHEHMMHTSSQLASKIQAYIKALDDARSREKTLAEDECRPPIQYWLELEHPKALSDVIESLLGALFISEDYDIAAIEAFFENVMRPFYDEHIRLSGCSSHPTSTLFKILESRSCQHFEMERVTQDKGVVRSDVVVHDAVLASATGSTKNAASRKASFEALLALERDSGFLSRTCDCRAVLASKKQAKQAQKATKAAKGGSKKGGGAKEAV